MVSFITRVMSLFLATLLTAIFLLVIGLPFLTGGQGARRVSLGWLRSTAASVILFGGAALWFLWHIWQLGPADFGQYKQWLLILFGVAAVGAFFYLPDFLAVRGAAALALLSSRVLLDAAYMQYDAPQRLVLVVFVYLAILAALYFGTVPFRLRDLLGWLWAVKSRARILGAVLTLWGLALLAISFTY